MAYDFFTAVPEPTVPISLFADAARAGAAVGNSIPTPVTAAIQGGIQGIQQGQQIASNAQNIEAQRQQNVVRQNQIEQLPVANEMDRLQLQNAEMVNNINAIKLRLQQKTEQQNLQLAEAKAKEELMVFETKEQIASALSGGDPKSILKDPKMNQVMFSDSKYMTSVLGALAAKGVLTEDEKTKLFEQADFVRAQELKAQERMARDRAHAAGVAQLDKVSDKLTNSPDIINSLSAAGVDNPEDLWHKDVQVVRVGQKTYKKDKDGNDTNVVDTAVPDRFDTSGSNKSDAYDIIIDGVRTPQTLYSKEDAALVNSYVKLGRQRYGIESAKAPTAVQTPPAAPEQKGWWERNFGGSTPATPPKSMDQINAGLQKQGIPPEQAASILNEARQRGEDMNMIQRVVSGILPDFLEENPVAESAIEQFNELGAAKDSRVLINTIAPQMADKTMAELKSGSSEAKQAMREWAIAENVKLTKAGLTDYYSRKLRTGLAEAYRDSMTLGVAEKAQAVRNENAVEATRNLLRNKTPDEVMAGAADKQQLQTSNVPDFFFDQSVREGSNVVQDLDTRLADLQQKYKFSNQYAAGVKQTAARVDTNPQLKEQPPYVKAVAAVESGGRTAATSTTGVKGLMQVTKKTAAGLNSTYGTDHNRLTPEGSVALGKLYLDELKTMFPGAPALAYAAYNAGPGVIKYAQKLAGGSTEWAELKPYLLRALTYFQSKEGWRPAEKLKELQNYPERVALYEQLFSGSSANG